MIMFETITILKTVDVLMMGCVVVVSRFKARPEEGAVHLLEKERQEGSEGSTAGRFSG